MQTEHIAIYISTFFYRYSLKTSQGFQILNFPNLIVIEVQLFEIVQLFQVLNALNQILTETKILMGGEKKRYRYMSLLRWIYPWHNISFGSKFSRSYF